MHEKKILFPFKLNRMGESLKFFTEFKIKDFVPECMAESYFHSGMNPPRGISSPASCQR